MKTNYKRLIFSLLAPQLAGLIGSFFTVSSVSTWYAALQKPSFSPPNWIFGPTWILLYFLMGVSVYLVWQEGGSIRLFLIHLLFNASWSIVFFGLRNPALAFINILLIWMMIVVLIVKFWSIKKISAILLVPYLLWVSFASVLNFFIWKLNF